MAKIKTCTPSTAPLGQNKDDSHAGSFLPKVLLMDAQEKAWLVHTHATVLLVFSVSDNLLTELDEFEDVY